MEANKFCNYCQQESNNIGNFFECGHGFCISCFKLNYISSLEIISIEKEIEDLEKFKSFKCICCDKVSKIEINDGNKKFLYSNDEEKHFEEICGNECGNKANIFCENCDALLCNECNEKAHLFKFNAKHKRIYVEEWKKVKVRTCLKHKESLKLYCTDCKTLLCVICLNGDVKHKTHLEKVICSNDFLDSQRNIIQEKIDNLKKIKNHINEEKIINDKYEINCKKIKLDLKNENKIKEKFKKLQKIIKNCERKCLKNRTEQFDMMISFLKKKGDMLISFNKLIDEFLDDFNNNFTISNYEKITKKISLFEKIDFQKKFEIFEEIKDNEFDEIENIFTNKKFLKIENEKEIVCFINEKDKTWTDYNWLDKFVEEQPKYFRIDLFNVKNELVYSTKGKINFSFDRNYITSENIGEWNFINHNRKIELENGDYLLVISKNIDNMGFDKKIGNVYALVVLDKIFSNNSGIRILALPYLNQLENIPNEWKIDTSHEEICFAGTKNNFKKYCYYSSCSYGNYFFGKLTINKYY